MSRLLALMLLLAVWVSAGTAEIPAFPGAEGFGKSATGGRGGEVYAVTTLSDAGPGSLRDAVSAPNRIVVFRVAGTIALDSALSIEQPNLTIAGQTSPGGVCIRNHAVVVRADNIILRHLRFRPGDLARGTPDSLSIAGGDRIMVDHCSASWSIDETLSVTGETTDNVTVQWCIISESLLDSLHPKGPHGMGSLIRPHDAHLSFHHNLYAHHNSRSPRPGTYGGAVLTFDFRNNVVYDWGGIAGYSGGEGEHVRMNYVGNWLKAGPSTSEAQWDFAFASGSADTHIFLKANVINGKTRGRGMVRGATTWVEEAFETAPVATDEAEKARDRVLEGAGATLPKRDAVDLRVVHDVRAGTGTIIDSQQQVGGWPELPQTGAPPDTDGDGMPDAWEAAHGLDPEAAAVAGHDSDGDGYTDIEEYLNATNPLEIDWAETR